MTSFQKISDDAANIDLDFVVTEKPTPNIQSQKINTAALNGLRGILSIHIMIHHSFEFSKLRFTLLGSIQMPLFFLISGFVFALNDGSKKIYSKTKCCTKLSQTDETENKFNARNFYLRRIARTVPLYYLTSFMAEPLVYTGYSLFVTPGIFNYISIVCTITITASWLGPFLLNPPAWFVSTIWFFYWIFPSLLPELQRYTTQSAQQWIRYHYILQFLIAIAIYIGIGFLDSISDFAFNIATMWPPSRLSVFIVGILGGLLRNKDIPLRNVQINYTKNEWNKLCNYLWMIMNVALVIGVFVERMTNGMSNLALWLQLIIVYFQVEFVYGLTKCDMDTCVVYKWLTSRVLIYFGRISYSLYLVHFPLMGYICLILNGVQSQPDCPYDSDDTQCVDEWDIYNDNRLMPIWCIPIHCVVSIILAIILHHGFENPIRKCLRP